MKKGAAAWAAAPCQLSAVKFSSFHLKPKHPFPQGDGHFFCVNGFDLVVTGLAEAGEQDGDPGRSGLAGGIQQRQGERMAQVHESRLAALVHQYPLVAAGGVGFHVQSHQFPGLQVQGHVFRTAVQFVAGEQPGPFRHVDGLQQLRIRDGGIQRPSRLGRIRTPSSANT